MSRVKASVLIIGLIAVVAVAFVGASSYVGSSSKDSGKAVTGCGSHEEAAATQAESGCAGTKTASKVAATAQTSTAADKGCPVSSCPMSKSGCAKTCGSKSTKTAKIESIEDREGKTFVLTGRYVCATCDLGAASKNGKCQPAFQTKEGKNYLLSKNNLSEQLRGEARDKDVEISSRVRKLDGVRYLEVEAIRAAS